MRPGGLSCYIDAILMRSIMMSHNVSRRGLACALCTLMLAVSTVMASETAWPEAEALNCSALEGVAPSSVQGWLEKSLWASHCYRYQARAVTISRSDVSTLALSHRIQEGVRQQVVQHLDGPSMSIERHTRVGHWGWDNIPETTVPVPAQWARHLDRFYAISLEADKRVAGRDAVKITFAPRDTQRYSHQWWLDVASGLMLKHVLRDTDGNILETFQVTQLQNPERYDGDVDLQHPGRVPESDWQVNWLPEGFQLQPSVSPLPAGGFQQRYSDGLATLSLFVEPVSASSLPRGLHQLSVSSVAVERYQRAGVAYQVVAIGEIPPEMLRRIVRSVEHTANASG